MLKVIIADDEPKVCKLILKLVNWDELGMEVVAISNDGETAFQEICEKQPHIVITDIRMPIYDGIELIRRAKELYKDVNFIVISGYSQFEYAQQAIKYGVDDYLLKPIKKMELKKALEKIAEKQNLIAINTSEKENLRVALSTSSEKAKKNLIWEMLNNPLSSSWDQPLEELNRKFYCQLNGPFVAAIARPFPRSANYSNEMYYMLLSKLQLLMEKRVNECCPEGIVTVWDSEIVFFLDIHNASLSLIEKSFQKAVRDAYILKNIYQEFDVVVGLGLLVGTVKQLIDSYNSAKTAIDNRFVSPGQSVISASQPEERPFRESVFSAPIRDKIIARFEHLDFKGVLDEIRNIRYSLHPIDGRDVYEYYHGIVETIFYSIRNYFPDFSLPDISFFLKRYQYMPTTDSMFDWLCDELNHEFEQYLIEKEYKESKPIVLAKQYINQNFGANLTLKDVSAAIGFNPAYFSCLFKKETGQNFLDYITEIRVNIAKSVLIKTDLDVADVGNYVGYSDVKYFSRLFKKITGLSPREYRRLYS